ncbi:MAG: DUF6311 domain-containing protein [Rhodanobacteraceae bacterium]
MPDATAARATRERPSLAVALGVVFAALTLSPGYIAGIGAFWQRVTGDVAMGQIGWLYYAHDIWRFPLFAIGNFHLPEGSNLLLSDSLPLMALPAKLLYRLAWPAGSVPPNYVGLWVASCLVLQAVAASRLLLALDVRKPASHIAGVVLFCYLPMLFLRFGHAGLMGQFFILLALDGYVRAKRHGLTRRQWFALCAWPVLALMLHPYLAAMSGLLVVTAILDQWRDGRLDIREVLVRLGSMAAAVLLIVWIGGFASAAGTGFGDYGLYSLNLLSPFVPLAGTLSGRLLHTTTPDLPGLYQWEGACYLGAGVLLLCLAALPSLRNLRAGLRRHLVLAIMLAVVLLFAISNRVGFGSHELFNVPLSARVIGWLSEFRGSGRFVWIAVYTLLAALIAVVVHRYRGRSVWLLAAAALLQIVDVAPMQAAVRAASARAAEPAIDRTAWRKLIGEHDRIFEFPSFECGGLFGRGVPGTRWRVLGIDWIAARLDKPNNSAYQTRYTKNCARERSEATTNFGQPGTLYLYRSSQEIGALLAADGAITSRCGYLDDVVVCSASEDLSNLR